MSKKRIIGTTAAAIKDAEFQLKMRLPESFVEWLLLNNGRSLGALVIFPVYDSRDPRKTWESIVKVYDGSWSDWLENFSDDGKDFSGLLPFAEFGTGDFYCFNYKSLGSSGEPVVGIWSHETGDFLEVADSFNAFVNSSNRPG
ncbi:SMI1/KNR4 family protein [Pseudomonas entomophila]|uniref:SMI1/KNR4 family protein n=1 Tax=Pseudomonas entomophila TaxID=312306 RepID=UPI001EFFA967|nr:SMI1/KNR4 family protein [Pseudomonas entomophila]MCG8295138.1 SMI1/KNR4 family protein [Pseudomonas entomophila]